jgi:hypothetical protein
MAKRQSLLGRAGMGNKTLVKKVGASTLKLASELAESTLNMIRFVVICIQIDSKPVCQ